MNIVSWIAVIIVLLSALNGFRRGFVSSFFSTLTIIIAIVAAVLISPQLSSRMMESSFYDTIDSGVQSALYGSYNNSTNKTDGSPEGENQGTGGMSEMSTITFLSEDTPSDSNGNAAVSDGLDELIESLPLPESVKQALAGGNNADTYAQWGVNAFQSYVSSYITRLIIRILAFIIVFFIVFTILKLISLALGLASRMPVLGAMNRLGGLLFGIVNGVFILWLICTAVTVFGGTQIASYINEGINGSRLLSALYNNNILLDILTRFGS